ncbi:MAG TPA: 3-dehydroquinate synthase [Planctomycetaceae bacterium]|nr:MAG: 3-dehydroquinate synthase [Phycisphaeraceae bacterium]HAO71969.1 3-dehydroquinate synthase [Planctomycetaceae bacterium]HAU48757.1 3-dehydroquinate synthase [Planctomycetaceae bacterium]
MILNEWRRHNVERHKINVRLDESVATTQPAARSYTIHVGDTILQDIGGLLKTDCVQRAVIVSDQSVNATHAKTVAEALQDASITIDHLTIPSGEASKSLAEAERLWNEFARLKIDRKTAILAVGGGVIGDLTGFVAATFSRGLDFWQVPTTLVAQVDSAIGGKTGVNLPAGKNLVGAFWQPRGVVADISTLTTLPDREYVSGLAEVVKYGMILDTDFFHWLEDNALRVKDREKRSVAHIVRRSAELKTLVVERDEREITGLRACLNYGHTFAHAFETATGYGTLLHGEAVSLGMMAAASLACSMNRIDQLVVDRQQKLLETLGLPVSTTTLNGIEDNDLLGIMSQDKKNIGGKLRFILPSAIGEVETVDNVCHEFVISAINKLCRDA